MDHLLNNLICKCTETGFEVLIHIVVWNKWAVEHDIVTMGRFSLLIIHYCTWNLKMFTHILGDYDGQFKVSQCFSVTVQTLLSPWPLLSILSHSSSAVGCFFFQFFSPQCRRPIFLPLPSAALSPTVWEQGSAYRSHRPHTHTHTRSSILLKPMNVLHDESSWEKQLFDFDIWL